MFKKIGLFLAVLLLLVSPVHASNQEKKEEYDNRLEVIEKEISKTEDKQELIGLSQKANEIAAYKRAYEKAINYTPGRNQTATMQLNVTNQPPSEYIPIYKAAADKYGVDWTLLAAVHKVETNFSTHPTMISSAGAIGHMQFMPGTWEYYGVDANGDGKADPWNLEDAIYSAANYLAASGAKSGKIKDSLFAYNRSTKYGNNVMNIAASYQESYINHNISLVDVGKVYISNSTYVFGGGRNETDIANGIFDCSSFVHWALTQTGHNAGELTSTTTDTLKQLGESVPVSEIKPGDLVFFDTYKKDGHVGIYAGNGQFIGAQESTGVAVADMTTGYWQDKFNGRVQRIEGR